MEQAKEHIERIQQAGIASLRSSLNQLLNSLGLITASGSATLLSTIIIVIFACNIFFALNLGVGFLLGEYFGSLGLGFLCLMGIYMLLLGIYLLYRHRVENNIQNRVAREMHHITDNINAELNEITELQVSRSYHETYISSEPFPYQALKLRRDEAIRQKQRASRDFKQGVQYLIHNYQSIFGQVVTQSIPGYRYISPFVNLFSSKDKHKFDKSLPLNKPKNNEPNFLDKVIKSSAPYLPYLSVALAFLKPVATSFIISKSQSWLLGKLLGLGRKKINRP